jgi:flagellar hook-basal body complex protein FliE
MSQSVGQVQQLETQAQTAIEGLMTGSGIDVHEVMIASQKAEMAFELMLSVRNKALAAYQQVVGMQF